MKSVAKPLDVQLRRFGYIQLFVTLSTLIFILCGLYMTFHLSTVSNLLNDRKALLATDKSRLDHELGIDTNLLEDRNFDVQRATFHEARKKMNKEYTAMKDGVILENELPVELPVGVQKSHIESTIHTRQISKQSKQNHQVGGKVNLNAGAKTAMNHGNLAAHEFHPEDISRELRKGKGRKGKKHRSAEEPIDLPIREEIPMMEISKTPPVLGSVVSNGSKPLFGKQHDGGDAIMALACKYPKQFYQRFVGSLRRAGYPGDVVLAVSPPSQMKPGVEQYLRDTNVVAYGFEVDCKGSDNCKLKDEFLGYPDPRPYRTFANIRYALYEYWLSNYNAQSHILILDFRDTFFQRDPFAHLGPVKQRPAIFDLNLYAENWKVKTIGKCVYNSMWLGRCFGNEQLDPIRDNAVICSGSTMGSFAGIHHYVRTMLLAMDRVKCWLKNIESDQGYQNYLFYNGFFHTNEGNATLFHQGNGVVNTIGAMNGFRVPAHMKGPLDTHWKIRDAEGYILNGDGSRSACVHQWDRFYDELHQWIDTKLYK